MEKRFCFPDVLSGGLNSKLKKTKLSQKVEIWHLQTTKKRPFFFFEISDLGKRAHILANKGLSTLYKEKIGAKTRFFATGFTYQAIFGSMGADGCGDENDQGIPRAAKMPVKLFIHPCCLLLLASRRFFGRHLRRKLSFCKNLTFD